LAVLLRLLLSTGNIFVSMVLGAIAMGAVWYWQPEVIQSLFVYANGVKAWLVSRGISAEYNNFLWFLIEEKQLVFMGFTIVVRIVLAILAAFFAALFGLNRA
jgi:hypothetical protein